MFFKYFLEKIIHNKCNTPSIMIHNNFDNDAYKKYKNHKIFKLLNDLKGFYNHIAINDESCSLLVVRNLLNINYEIFTSLSNTIDSILTLLNKGRINDSMALMRKYNDAVIIHVYSMILVAEEESDFLDENHKIYDNIVNEWVHGKQHLLKKEEQILNKIKSIDKELELLLFSNNDRKIYNKGRTIGDDNVHYNSYDMFTINNEQIMNNKYSIDYLDDAYNAIHFIFIIHFSYITRINPLSMVSSDYVCMLDSGLTPEEGSQNYAAAFVVNVFFKYIKPYNKELADYLNNCTFLEFDY